MFNWNYYTGILVWDQKLLFKRERHNAVFYNCYWSNNQINLAHLCLHLIWYVNGLSSRLYLTSRTYLFICTQTHKHHALFFFSSNKTYYVPWYGVICRVLTNCDIFCHLLILSVFARIVRDYFKSLCGRKMNHLKDHKVFSIILVTKERY